MRIEDVENIRETASNLFFMRKVYRQVLKWLNTSSLVEKYYNNNDDDGLF